MLKFNELKSYSDLRDETEKPQCFIFSNNSGKLFYHGKLLTTHSNKQLSTSCAILYGYKTAS